MLEFWRVSATLAPRWPHLNGSPAVGSGGRLSRTNPSTWPRKKRKCCAFLHSSVFLLGFVCLFPCVSLVVVDAARVSFDLVSSLAFYSLAHSLVEGFFSLLFANPRQSVILSVNRGPWAKIAPRASFTMMDESKGLLASVPLVFFPSAPASLSLSQQPPFFYFIHHRVILLVTASSRIHRPTDVGRNMDGWGVECSL